MIAATIARKSPHSRSVMRPGRALSINIQTKHPVRPRNKIAPTANGIKSVPKSAKVIMANNGQPTSQQIPRR